MCDAGWLGLRTSRGHDDMLFAITQMAGEKRVIGGLISFNTLAGALYIRECLLLWKD